MMFGCGSSSPRSEADRYDRCVGAGVTQEVLTSYIDGGGGGGDGGAGEEGAGAEDRCCEGEAVGSALRPLRGGDDPVWP